MKNQNISQTYQSFKDKWHLNRDLAFAETLREGSDIQKWITSRNGFNSIDDFQGWLGNRERILDAGCGNGRVTALLRMNTEPTQEIVGIDLTAASVAKENLSGSPNLKIYEKDLLGDLSGIGKFDLIYCQEVLHHTADPAEAFSNLVELLSPEGEIAIYVYKKKAPIREHADDFVRDIISEYEYEKAFDEMKKITELGRALSELDVTIEVPEIELLGIEGGKYHIQRLIYHFFLKCFWNPNMSFESNAAINYDWYHPQLCTRHTPDEVKLWFEKNAIEISHFHVDHYGITARGLRK